ncbi:MAG: M56 family metallopeptidase [Bacteroidales bacterium]|nr:M56 family metallopeptidase [Bacteroidales bacterium]
MSFDFLNALESAITLAIFYLFYKIVLRNETFFKMNRLYLLSSLLFAVTVPFLNINLNVFSNYFSSGNNIFQEITGFKRGYNEISEVIIYAYSGKLTWTIIREYISIIYLLGVLISSVFFVFGLGKIILLIIRSKPVRFGKYRIVETADTIVPFSLFKWIIINPEKYSSDDMKQIIAHERMHAFQLHSFDLIFIEVLVILFWFNPFIYWYRKSIREVHEYLADRAVVENGYDRIDYQQLLLSQISGSRFIGLTSSFSYSLSKNRLKMLTMMKSKNISKIKIALAIPFAIVTLFFFVNSVDFAKANEKITNEISINLQDTTKVKLKNLEENIYFEVDVMPKFQGKEQDHFRVFIQENLKYPVIAQKNGISGRVFVQFDINSKGEVANAIVVRGADPELDKEALRVVNSSPKWEPGIEAGKPVIVRYTFPIVFALQKEE